MRKPTGTWIIAGLAFSFVIALILFPRQRGQRARLVIQPPQGVAKFRPIRVCLVPEAVTTVSIQIDGPFQVTPVGGTQILLNQPRQAKTAVTLVLNGFRWDQRELSAPRLEITPAANGAVWVGEKEYPGKVQLIRIPGGRMQLVNVVPLEDYVACVVDSEMPREFGPEARKAQAITARSYALAQMQNANPGAFYDLHASTRSQKYNGRRYLSSDGRMLAGDSAESLQLAYETAGMVCTYEGKLFCTYYSAVCSGRTSLGSDFFSDAAFPHQSVICEWCADSPLYRWQTLRTNAEVQEKLHRYFADQGSRFESLTSLAVGPVPHPGGVAPVIMSDGKQTVSLPATTFRRILGTNGLYSHHFQVAAQGTNWVFTGSGNGHGVGLCQWGARGLGHAGKNGLEILAHYYPGAEVVVLTDE
ncbi:MAG: SpoIID/LytB domain protein [Planctomycetaceae bacterium]|nr:SpoIID/LytB domain protein [Planctomycetaceae bacterium]